MGSSSNIEWTDATWTPIRASSWGDDGKFRIGWYCEHVSEGCRNCYAERMNLRLGTGFEFKPGHRDEIDIALDHEMLLAPLRWRKPRMVFVCSMTDLFADFVKDEWIDNVFAVMALSPQHTFQVLTKRPERMREYFENANTFDGINVAMDRIAPAHWCKRELQDYVTDGDLPLPNVWLGVSAERQQEADERIPLLLQTPAAVRFVSLEPLLGPICVTYLEWARLDWVIVGGESGPHARPMHPDWARSLRDQCAAAGVPFFFKQWGEWSPKDTINVSRPHALCGLMGNTPHIERDWLKTHDFKQKIIGLDGACVLERVGKKSAGRLLDGKEHSEFPSTDQTKRSAA